MARELPAWLALMVDVDPSVEAARQRIGRLSRLFTRMLDMVAADQDMSLGDWEALSVVVRAGGQCTPTLLAQELALTSGTVSTRLNRLTQAGLVTVVADADGRSRPVRITADGHRRWQEATAARTRAERDLFHVLEPDQLDAFNSTLQTLLAHYETAFGEASRHDRTGRNN
ncbi:MarR family winged helix-turn-helix transcriptional regulator [Catenulispora yoronensis]